MGRSINSHLPRRCGKVCLTCCQEKVCGRPASADDDFGNEHTSWEDLQPDLDTEEGEPFDPLPEFGEPPPWADLDEWDCDDD